MGVNEAIDENVKWGVRNLVMLSTSDLDEQ